VAVFEWAAPADRLDARIARSLHGLSAPPTAPPRIPEDLRDLIPPLELLRPAAVLLGLVDRGEGSRVILTRRTEALAHHPGQVAFPGGRQDARDPGLLETAIREAHEEIALDPAHVQPLGYIDPMPTFTGFLVLPVVARVSPLHQSRPEPGEVAEVFEVPLAYLMDPANLRIERAELAGRARQTWRFDYAGQRIWGATAAMLINLRDRLQAR
jgi:8-oxo-dGTP pyrophosphatase MutT (NUDIX family)